MPHLIKIKGKIKLKPTVNSSKILNDVNYLFFVRKSQLNVQ